MNRGIIWVTGVLLGGLTVGAAHALEVEDAWVRGMPPGHHSTAAYMTLENPADEAVRVVDASAAETSPRVELHTHVHDDGVMRMRPVEDFEVPAGGERVLEPGGDHIMLMELSEMPAPGEEVEITLELDDGEEVTVRAPVRMERGQEED